MSLSQYYAALGTMARWTAAPSPETLRAARAAWQELRRGGYAHPWRFPTLRGWPELLAKPQGGSWTWAELAELGLALTLGPVTGGTVAPVPEPARQAVGDALRGAATAAGEGLSSLYRWGVGLGVLAAIFVVALVVRSVLR